MIMKILGNIGLFTWLLGAFAAAAFIGASALDRTHSTLQDAGKMATATIAEKFEKRAGNLQRGILEYYLRYQFQLPTGEMIEGVKRVEESFQDQYAVGDTLPARYSESDPKLSEVELGEYAEGAEAVRAFAWLFTVFVAIGLGSALIRTLRRDDA